MVVVSAWMDMVLTVVVSGFGLFMQAISTTSPPRSLDIEHDIRQSCVHERREPHSHPVGAASWSLDSVSQVDWGARCSSRRGVRSRYRQPRCELAAAFRHDSFLAYELGEQPCTFGRAIGDEQCWARVIGLERKRLGAFVSF